MSVEIVLSKPVANCSAYESVDLAGGQAENTFAVAQRPPAISYLYNMSIKQILMSQGSDRHGDYKPLEILEKMVDSLNEKRKMRMLVNHRRDLPPMGYWTNAEIVDENGTKCVAAQEEFYTAKSDCEWDNNLAIANLNLSAPFKEIAVKTQGDDIFLSLDKVNFASVNEIKKLAKDIEMHSAFKTHISIHARKHLIPHPELIIQSAIIGVFWAIGKKVGEKILDKFTDDLYEISKDKIKAFQKSISKTISYTRQRTIPKNIPLSTIFEIPGEIYVELIAKTDNADLIAKSLSIEKLSKIKKEIEKFSELVAVSEIQFELTEKGSWKFTYLLTDQSQIIGTKAKFKERDRLVQKIRLSSTAGFSVGAGNIKYDKPILD